jgi:hypothetical protein
LSALRICPPPVSVEVSSRDDRRNIEAIVLRPSQTVLEGYPTFVASPGDLEGSSKSVFRLEFGFLQITIRAPAVARLRLNSGDSAKNLMETDCKSPDFRIRVYPIQ